LQNHWVWGLCQSSGILTNQNDEQSPQTQCFLSVMHHRQNPLDYTNHFYLKKGSFSFLTEDPTEANAVIWLVQAIGLTNLIHNGGMSGERSRECSRRTKDSYTCCQWNPRTLFHLIAMCFLGDTKYDWTSIKRRSAVWCASGSHKTMLYRDNALIIANVTRLIYLCWIAITPWPESTSELYRPSDRRLSAKLVPTFADSEVSRSQRSGSPTAVISVF
jgi:hypothetical protein